MPAQAIQPQHCSELAGDIFKVDTDRRLVFGWASVVSKAGAEDALVDRQGDVLDLDTLEAAIYAYVQDSRDADEMHKRAGVGTLVESLLFTPEKIAKMGLPPDAVPVGWWVGFHITNDDVWDRVKKGQYKMFSIRGLGQRQEI